MELLERPPRYRGPNLDPTGVRLKPKRLADGVYALLADKLPRNNHGLVVGRDAALLIDAGINHGIARQLQRVARTLTDKPVRYLVNTVYHGDHTFGNAAFPASTQIVASRRTAQSMTDLDYEKRARAENLFGNLDVLAHVTTWREPDLLLDDHLALDLGGREVELWHFGPGNSPGDTVVRVPEARAACTGNLVSNQRALTMLLEIPPGPYIDPGQRLPPAQRPGHLPLPGGRRPACRRHLRSSLGGPAWPGGSGPAGCRASRRQAGRAASGSPSHSPSAESSSRDRRNTASSIVSVRRRVAVFCWLTW